MGKEYFVTERLRAFYVYERSQDGAEERVIRCRPKEGYHLFRVIAGYSANSAVSAYYFLARNTMEVRQQVQNILGKITIIGIYMIDDPEERKRILSDPLRMP